MTSISPVRFGEVKPGPGLNTETLKAIVDLNKLHAIKTLQDNYGYDVVVKNAPNTNDGSLSVYLDNGKPDMVQNSRLVPGNQSSRELFSAIKMAIWNSIEMLTSQFETIQYSLDHAEHPDGE
jgi:hypothetical protein